MNTVFTSEQKAYITNQYWNGTSERAFVSRIKFPPHYAVYLAEAIPSISSYFHIAIHTKRKNSQVRFA